MRITILAMASSIFLQPLTISFPDFHLFKILPFHFHSFLSHLKISETLLFSSHFHSKFFPIHRLFLIPLLVFNLNFIFGIFSSTFI